MANIRVNGIHVRVKEANVSRDGKTVEVIHLNDDVETFTLSDKSKAVNKSFPYPDRNESALVFQTDETYTSEDFKGALVYPEVVKLEKEQAKAEEVKPEPKPEVSKGTFNVPVSRPVPLVEDKKEEKKD